MIDVEVFNFERDFAASLRCVPMAVRLKLDLAGIKLTLRQWSRFTVEDRQMLMHLPCGTAEEIDDYRITLVELVAARADELAKPLAEDVTAAEWEQADRVPKALLDYADFIGVAEPTLAQWATLSRLQRFTLLKLTRDHHDNINFVPAMVEFGLIQSEGRRAHLK
jgi:hypothetical protein